MLNPNEPGISPEVRALRRVMVDYVLYPSRRAEWARAILKANHFGTEAIQ